SEPDYGPGLEWSYSQSGIPRMPSRKLALTFLRLPPILYKLYKHSISDYSKAPRGLSVLSRVMRIFTHSIISPGLSLRQCSRSEEHTSELQSRFDLVCRLLLEKKKNNHADDTMTVKTEERIDIM